MRLKRVIQNWYRFLNPKFQNLYSEFPVDLKPRYGKEGHPLLVEIIQKNKNQYLEWINRIIGHRSSFEKWSKSKRALEPKWNNGFLPALDMMSLYTVVSSLKPNVYIEIGSGNSTIITAQAIKDHELKTQIISIDPQPREEIDQLSDIVIRNGLEHTNLDQIKNLEKGDILFIDNSHRILPNSDATVVFMDILPYLKAGVVVHIHDVYLPYDYPQFMCDRFYSEQYGLALMVLSNPKRYHTILANYYVSQDPQLKDALDPIWSIPAISGGEKHGGSYWIEIRD